MYECPNCAGNLIYRIDKQALYCKHCNGTISPYHVQKDRDAIEQDFFETTIYTCPQCGGELLTENTTVATFCSYCGASTLLQQRISREKKPKFIIPFTKTKEDCRSSYQKMMRAAFLAPDDLKDSKHLEKFRGIYMPYYLYSFHKNGESIFHGTKTHQEGQYDITEYYDIPCHVVADYEDLAFDASATFSDTLSRTIAPFDLSAKKPFTPSFLSGFYADRSDLPVDFYHQEAEEVVRESISSIIKDQKDFSAYAAHDQMKSTFISDSLKPESAPVDLALFPVWFLSYRKNDRVAYAVVNGQTGEAAADLPIDIRKFILSSLLLAVPIIIILNMFLTLTPAGLLILCAVLSSLCGVAANLLTTNLLFKESMEDVRLLSAQEKESKRQKKKIETLLIGIAAFALELPIMIALFFIEIGGRYLVAPIAISAAFIIYLCLDLYYLKKPKVIEIVNPEIYEKTWKKKLHILLKPMITVIFALLVVIINPVSDFIFYGAALFCMGMIFLTIRDIVNCHNLLTTRPLPQLGKRGGDHYA